MVEVTGWVRRLRGCILSRHLQAGRLVHAEILEQGHGRNVLLANLLVQMYGACGRIAEARAVFDGLRSRRNVFSGNIMVAAYAHCGHLGNAWEVFQEMPEKNVVSWNTIIAVYCSTGHIEEAKILFDLAGVKDVCSWNALIAAYAQNGHFFEAEVVFYRQPARTLVSWNSILRGYAQDGDLDSTLGTIGDAPEKDSFSWAAAIQAYARAGHVGDAAAVFERMTRHCSVTVTAMIQAYGQAGLPSKARKVFESQLPARDLITWTAFLSALAANGMVQDAKNAFDWMPERNSVSWNVVVSAYAQKRGGLGEALRLASRMPQHSVTASNALIEALALNGEMDGAVEMFKAIPNRDSVTWNCLALSRTKAGDMEAAASVVARMPQYNVVTWTTMVSGYSRNGDAERAVHVFFRDMKQRNVVSWNSMLQALLEAPDHLDGARKLFDRMPQHDVVSWTSLVAKLASKPELQDEARNLFQRMPERDTAAWSAMIAAYARSGPARASLELLRLMDLEGVEPDAATFVSALDACATLAALLEGRLLHSIILSSARLELSTDRILATALVNMYAKCSRLDEAQRVFDAMEERDVVSWNALVAGYSHHGHGSKVFLELLPEMVLQGVNPDSVTLTSIICAHSHVGLLDGGLDFFGRIREDFGVEPTLDNFVCLVDLLGRAGRVEEAEELVESMPFEPDSATGMNLVGAHGGNAAGAGLVLELEPDNLAPYVLLANMLASC